MNDVNELISESNKYNLEILKIKSIPDTQNIALLKTNQDSEYFIEILDFENNSIKKIVINNKISSITEFHPIDDEFIYLYCNYKHNENFYSHLKINFEGEIIFYKKFVKENYSSYHNHNLKNYIFREDMVLLDLSNFEEYKLFDFFSDNFDEDLGFTYIYFTEQRYKIFTLPDDNILGIEIFDKDGDEPRFYYFILKIESADKIRIKFIGNIEDCGEYTFSNNSKELAYISSYYKTSGILQIRELSNEKFNNSKQLNINNSIEKEYYLNGKKMTFVDFEKIIYFDEEKIILNYVTEMKIYSRENEVLLNSAFIDKNSSYLVKNNTLFFIKNSKLSYFKI